jgi:hypothetical protein
MQAPTYCTLYFGTGIYYQSSRQCLCRDFADVPSHSHCTSIIEQEHRKLPDQAVSPQWGCELHAMHVYSTPASLVDSWRHPICRPTPGCL